MTKEEHFAIATAFEDNYFAVINENGAIHYANEKLVNCIHIENTHPCQNHLFNFLSPGGVTNLREALQRAGSAANPSYLKMNLLNSAVHPAAWYIARLKTAGNTPALFICVGHETNSEKPTNKNGSNQWA